MDNIACCSDATFANNTISVSQSAIGITINRLYGSAGNITVANNTITAQANVTSSTPFRTRGINVFPVYNGTINLNNNTIAGPGQFDRGINIWNTVNNVNINGGSVSSAAVGVKVDGVDSYYGRTIINTNVSIANATISGQVGLTVTFRFRSPLGWKWAVNGLIITAFSLFSGTNRSGRSSRASQSRGPNQPIGPSGL